MGRVVLWPGSGTRAMVVFRFSVYLFGETAPLRGLPKNASRAHCIEGTKKKLKCQLCSEYNDTGSAKPFTGPALRKWRKIHEKNGNRRRSRSQSARSSSSYCSTSSIQISWIGARESIF